MTRKQKRRMRVLSYRVDTLMTMSPQPEPPHDVVDPCPRCGALVLDAALHEKWHQDQPIAEHRMYARTPTP